MFFLIFNFITLFRLLTPKKYYSALHHLNALEIGYFLVYHMSRYLLYEKRYDHFSATGPNRVFSYPL